MTLNKMFEKSKKEKKKGKGKRELKTSSGNEW